MASTTESTEKSAICKRKRDVLNEITEVKKAIELQRLELEKKRFEMEGRKLNLDKKNDRIRNLGELLKVVNEKDK